MSCFHAPRVKAKFFPFGDQSKSKKLSPFNSANIFGSPPFKDCLKILLCDIKNLIAVK